MPYTYGPLVSDLYISSDTKEKQPTVILNMADYCIRNIPNYGTIREIPSEHSPEWINTSLAQNWDSAFGSGRYLKTLPDPFYDTSNATNMHDMFSMCSNLTTVPNFDTSNVTYAGYMFEYCSNLTTVPNFDFSNVNVSAGMFEACYRLITTPNFNFNRLGTAFCMFERCTNLTTVTNFNTKSAYQFSRMFYSCTNLTTIPNFDTSKVTDMSDMFYQCHNLINIPIFNIARVTNIPSMFNRCTNIRGDLYIESNNMYNARNLFANTPNYVKNIYCHANSNTYNKIYNAMGNNTYNSNWNAYLLTMEDNYATINWTGNGIYRFPTNKIMVEYQRGDVPGGQLANEIIEISPYTDYNLSVGSLPGPVITPGSYLLHGTNVWSNKIIVDANTIIFRFFKDIPNMTANVVDLL